MTEPSTPSQPLSVATVAPPQSVAELIEAARNQGLRLTPDRPELDRTGLDFLVAHAHDEQNTPWIVRAPRRPDVFASSLVEARVLRLVGPRLPVAVPEWRVQARDVIAYPRLFGTPAIEIEPSGTPRWNVIDPTSLPDAFLDSFAQALAALQTITPAEAEAAGVPRRSLDEARRAFLQAIDQTHDALAPSAALRSRWRRWLERDDTWPPHLALVHGDLHPGHLLLDGGACLVGILDWTEACVADPSIDLAMFFGCFGQAALEALVPRFERCGGRVWPRLVEHAAERWAAFPVLAAEWALRTHNEGALAHARNLVAAASEG